jgi:hypothetical protein
MPKNDDDAPVILGYGAASNISFHGKRETGYTWGEWRTMTDAERDQAIDEVVYELVEVYVLDEEY